MNGILTATAVVKDKNIEFQNEAFALLMERLKLEDVFKFVEGHETVKILHAGSDSVLCFQAGYSDRKMFMAVPCGEIEEAITLPDFIIFFENTLRNIFNCIKASIYITDNKGNLLMINSEAERTGGLTYDDIVGKNMQELIDCGFCTQSSSLAVIRSGMEESLVDSDDSGYQLLITGVPCRRQGNMELVVTVERDLRKITELRRELEYVNEKMQLYEEELGYLRERELKPIEAIYESNVMKKIVGLALKLTKSDMNVLIQGESGVGKEVIADIIYKYGNRANQPFIKINCGAIPENLLESELFGYEKGAFTGAATKGKIGLVELANNGTLLLDEISSLSLSLQPKLLRVIQHGELIRVGGEKIVKVNVRIIAVSNMDLREAVEKGTFRDDLYYRLNVIPINIPPLRERKEDIIPLAMHFIEKYNTEHSSNGNLNFEALNLLTEYSWPGNVRELENIIQRAIFISGEKTITYGNILRCFSGDKPKSEMVFSELSLPKRVEEFEKQAIQELYEKYNSVTKVAEALNVSKSTISKKLKKYKLKT